MRSQIKPWLRNVLGFVLVLSGLVGFWIGGGGNYSSHLHTEGSQDISDVRVGLVSSPFYVSHVEEPIGGADFAIERGEAVHVVRETRWNYFSWSFFLMMAGIGAVTWGLLLLIRKPKNEPQSTG